MSKRILLSILSILMLCANAHAQRIELDSILNIIKSSKHDSNEVNLLIELSNKYRTLSPDSALLFASKAKTLAEKVSYPKGAGYALKAEGMVYNLQGNYIDALRIWKDGLKVFEDANIQVGAANLLNNIGTIYYNKSDETNALDYYLRSLKVSEEIKDTLRIATALMNLGGVYSNKPTTYNKSLEYHKKSLDLSKEINDTALIGIGNANIGEILLKQNKLDSALAYLIQARNIYKGSSDLAFTLNIIGKVYQAKKEFNQAIQFHKQAFDTATLYEVKLDKAQALLGIAESYKAMNDYTAAIETYLKAQLLFEEIGLDESYDLKSVYEGLSSCYTSQKNYPKALEYAAKLLDLKDKIYNIEVDKSLGTKLFAFEIDKKQSEIKIQQQQISRQNLLRNGLLGGIGILLLFTGVFFVQRNRISKEKKRSDDLLLNIIPSEIAEEIKRTGTVKAKDFIEVTVMFTDFKNFTRMSENLSAQELVNEIHHCYSVFDEIMMKYGIEKIKTIGDSYMCASGLPVEKKDHALHMAEAALEVIAFVEQEKNQRESEGKPFFEIRIGLNSGSVVAGIVGVKKFAYDIWGDTVNIASRMESAGEPGKINISGATYELIKSKYKCTYRGKIDAKNKGAIDMYFIDE